MNFNLDKINKTPNTVLSHLLIILSEQFNLGNEIKGKIYQNREIALVFARPWLTRHQRNAFLKIVVNHAHHV